MEKQKEFNQKVENYKNKISALNKSYLIQKSDYEDLQHQIFEKDSLIRDLEKEKDRVFSFFLYIEI